MSLLAAVQRICDGEHVDRVVVPAPVGRGHGFTPKELDWILAVILGPYAAVVEEGLSTASLEAVA